MTVLAEGAARTVRDREPATLDVTVVLPCLDEETSVGLCVTEAAEAIERAGWSGEVVVVDNGSTDRSAEVAVAAGARVVVESTKGYGAALRRGFSEARGAIVVMADADSTYPLAQLDQIVQPVMDDEVDLMIGSRLSSASRHTMPLLHRFIGTPTLTWLVREGTGASGLSDSQSGFRAFRRDVMDDVGLRSDGMELASEMLIRAAVQGLRTQEVPLGYRDRLGDSKLSTWRDGMRHLRLICRMSPHLMLWKPGLVFMALGLITYVLGFVNPTGTAIGAVTWDPIYLGTILLILGLLAALSGAMLARNAPGVSAITRARFEWLDRPGFARGATRVGTGVALIGLAIDGWLFALWITQSGVATTTKLHLAALAQGMILAGTILAVVAAIYRVVSTEHRALTSVASDPRL